MYSPGFGYFHEFFDDHLVYSDSYHLFWVYMGYLPYLSRYTLYVWLNASLPCNTALMYPDRWEWWWMIIFMMKRISDGNTCLLYPLPPGCNSTCFSFAMMYYCWCTPFWVAVKNALWFLIKNIKDWFFLPEKKVFCLFNLMMSAPNFSTVHSLNKSSQDLSAKTFATCPYCL